MVVGSVETSFATWTRELVEGRTIDMLLDTGSAVTILSAEVWNVLRVQVSYRMFPKVS